LHLNETNPLLVLMAGGEEGFFDDRIFGENSTRFQNQKMKTFI